MCFVKSRSCNIICVILFKIKKQNQESPLSFFRFKANCTVNTGYKVFIVKNISQYQLLFCHTPTAAVTSGIDSNVKIILRNMAVTTISKCKSLKHHIPLILWPNQVHGWLVFSVWNYDPRSSLGCPEPYLLPTASNDFLSFPILHSVHWIVRVVAMFV